MTDEFDLVIVGSGGGGLTAALAAHAAGLSAVVLEKQHTLGGSTAISGGAMWVPANSIMREAGVDDSLELGLQYFNSVVGEPDEPGGPSTLARRTAFIVEGGRMIDFLRKQGVKLGFVKGYSDYYDLLPGGLAIGRGVEGVPWDINQLGDWKDRINEGLSRRVNLAVTTNEVRNIAMTFRSIGSFLRTARVVARTTIGRWRGKNLVANGMSLIGQLTKLAMDKGIPLWADTPLESLIVENGRVVGVNAKHGDEIVQIRARRGVLLAAGGFERSGEFRVKATERTQPATGEYSMANLGNTGDALKAAIALGAKTDFMDEAIWFPTPRFEMAGSTLTLARQYAGTIFVNQQGRRFVNESNSYVEVGRAMYANDAMPCWLIWDDAYRRRIPWSQRMPKWRDLWSVRPGNMPKEWIQEDWIYRADTVEALAGQIGLDPGTLRATLDEFNAHAARGEDPLFHRGESAYNKVLGDPGCRTNPCVTPIARGPFYATRIYAGDVGTIGGVVCDEHARVLDHTDTPIPGLYATGNMAATVMGRTYPGGGASIANTATFGYIAAQHAASTDRP